jgi:glycosyltransferase involved in cell wall biosynthesis
MRSNITRLATDNGIPGSKFVDLGLIPNEEMPDVLKEMDLAVFPNRCEGGTNLVAMETMACGVPCILAKNTGHLDIMNDGNCWVLEQQEPVSFEDMATDGWGESSVDELVALMERAYENRPQCRAIGQAGAQFMRSWSWQSQIELLLSNVEKILK